MAVAWSPTCRKCDEEAKYFRRDMFRCPTICMQCGRIDELYGPASQADRDEMIKLREFYLNKMKELRKRQSEQPVE